MSSIKCPECGFVTWAGATQCKRCGASLDSAHQSSSSSPGHISHTSDPAYNKGTVRRAGLKTIKSGAIVTALYVIFLVIVIIVNSGTSGYHFSFKLTGFAGLLPVAWLLAGVLQMVTGVPFDELSDRWDNLAGWQRGLIGVSVFLTGLLALAIVCIVIMFVLDWMQGTKRPLF